MSEKTHEELVNKFVSEYFKDKPNSTGLTRAQGDLIIAALKSIANNEKTDASLKKRIKKINFSLNDNGELYCENKPVVFMENFFDKLNEIHSDMGHPGVTKTTDTVNLAYSCVPRVVIEYHIKTCSICNLRQRQVKIQF